MAKWLRRWSVAGLVALSIPVLAAIGCSGADQPKLAEAPKFDPGPPKETPKIPGRKQGFSENSTYKKFMSSGQGAK